MYIPCHQGFGMARQVVQAHPESSVESFDEGHIDRAFSYLGGLDQAGHHCLAALDNASIYLQHPFNMLHRLHRATICQQNNNPHHKGRLSASERQEDTKQPSDIRKHPEQLLRYQPSSP